MWKDKTADGTEYWWDATFDANKGTWSYHEIYDFAPVINENLALQQDPRNGWTTERTARRIASIPLQVLLADKEYRAASQANASTADRQAALWKFIERHPEYRTVDKLKHDNANDGHVIIR